MITETSWESSNILKYEHEEITQMIGNNMPSGNYRRIYHDISTCYRSIYPTRWEWCIHPDGENLLKVLSIHVQTSHRCWVGSKNGYPMVQQSKLLRKCQSVHKISRQTVNHLSFLKPFLWIKMPYPLVLWVRKTSEKLGIRKRVCHGLSIRRVHESSTFFAIWVCLK